MRPSRNAHLIEALAATIKARRNELGLTQEDLAGAIDIDRPYITLMEAAKKQPTLSVLWRIAEGLELSAGELMTRVDQRYRELSVAARGKSL
ncbi:MAG: helix-turn-helix domain-containing protein [Leptothrix sp. (in: b-proteobacteria)]